jgi:hypothetical protein
MSKKTKWIFFLSHHEESNCKSKCFKTGIGSKRVYLCSRCSGLYPTMFLTLLLDLSIFPQMNSPLRALLFWIFSFWGFFHWANEHYHRKTGISKWSRFFSAIPAGFGTALLLGGHFINPWNYEFNFSIILLGCISFIVIFMESFFREN